MALSDGVDAPLPTASRCATKTCTRCAVKCAITRACYHDPEVQRAYAECAEGYGFKIEPWPARDPKKKGWVEFAVKYLKRSFVPLREFRDLVDANAQVRAWLLGPAGNHVHGTTHEQPLIRFVGQLASGLPPRRAACGPGWCVGGRRRCGTESQSWSARHKPPSMREHARACAAWDAGGGCRSASVLSATGTLCIANMPYPSGEYRRT